MKYILLSFISILILVSCSKDNTEPKTYGADISKDILSSSENFIARIECFSKDFDNNSSKWWYAKLTLLDKNGTILYEDPLDYALWFRFNVKWNKETLELHSGDVGSYVYLKKNDTWIKEQVKVPN